jgi:ribosomal protein S18 acetylase RimI-like enzyme
VRNADVRFEPIDLDRDFEICVRFLGETFVASYGSDAELGAMGGAAAYRESLRARLADFPAGHVHVWQGAEIAGQLEMRPRPDLGFGMVNLIYLAPERRGGTLSDALHDYLEATLRGCCMPKARLSVSPTNQRAVRYYLKHGWRDLGPRPDRPTFTRSSSTSVHPEVARASAGR